MTTAPFRARLVRTGGVLLAIFAFAFISACTKKLPRGTPAETLASARQVVLDGHANRLDDFIYADSPDMRTLLRSVGVFLGHVQRLGEAVQAKFPDQVRELAASAEESAKEGKATGLLSQLAGSINPGGRGRRGSISFGSSKSTNPDEARKAFEDALKRLFADPYAFLRESDGKIGTIRVTDDVEAITWEDKPVFPPFGLTLRKGEDSRWYFVLPTSLPGISGVMPHTKDQFEIIGGLVQVFDHVVVDLRKDVESGQVKSMDELSRRAGEKTFIPAAIVVLAYSKYQDSLKTQPGPTSATPAATPK